MEKRILAAFAASVAILAVYWYFVPSANVSNSAAPQEFPSPTLTESNTQLNTSSQQSTFSNDFVSEAAESIIKQDTSLYNIELSTKGAKITTLSLKNYKYGSKHPKVLYLRVWDWINGKQEKTSFDANRLIDMVTLNQTGGILTLGLTPLYNDIVYESSEWNIYQNEKSITFRAELNQNFSLVKTFTFYEDKYEIKLDFSLVNIGSQPSSVVLNLDVGSGNQIVETDYSASNKDAMALVDGDYDKYDSDEATTLNNYQWAAVTDTYFVTGVKKGTQQWTANFTPVNVQINGSTALDPFLRLNTQNIILNPNEKFSDSLNFYLGPKDIELLDNFDETFSEVLDLFFNIIARPMIYLLRWFFSYVGNWGVAIMCLTITVRLVLFPLAFKGMQSMKHMSKLSPKIQALRKKYPNDKQRLNTEVAKLYKKNKANPVVGCLPMLAQIPIFIALYWTLLPAIELRQNPFFLWINDLSIYDPYMILPLLMGVTMFIQQKLAPPPVNLDPMQQKIMRFFPVVMTLLFVNFPAGLVIYWVTSNVISSFQQLVFNRIKGKEIIE